MPRSLLRSSVLRTLTCLAGRPPDKKKAQIDEVIPRRCARAHEWFGLDRLGINLRQILTDSPE